MQCAKTCPNHPAVLKYAYKTRKTPDAILESDLKLTMRYAYTTFAILSITLFVFFSSLT